MQLFFSLWVRSMATLFFHLKAVRAGWQILLREIFLKKIKIFSFFFLWIDMPNDSIRFAFIHISNEWFECILKSSQCDWALLFGSRWHSFPMKSLKIKRTHIFGHWLIAVNTYSSCTHGHTTIRVCVSESIAYNPRSCQHKENTNLCFD